MFNEIITAIKKKCAESNHLDVIDEIDLHINSGSTGGEIVLNVGVYLLSLKKNRIDLYKLVKDEIIAYVKACEENGIVML
jgi:hypothetical protein